MRLSDARLQLVSFRKLNSEQGFVAYWRSELRHRVPVVDDRVVLDPRVAADVGRLGHAAEDRAGGGSSIGAPPTTAWVVHSPSRSTARMKSSVTRTEWFAFWKKTQPYASPVNEAS